jgi:tRNA 2-thiouridine synthesizing protein A
VSPAVPSDAADAADAADPAAAAGVVDARGLRCPLPVIRLAQRAAGLAPGTVLEVWATDPAAALDVPAWARLRGHELLADDPGDGPGDEPGAAPSMGDVLVLRVRLG